MSYRVYSAKINIRFFSLSKKSDMYMGPANYTVLRHMVREYHINRSINISPVVSILTTTQFFFQVFEKVHARSSTGPVSNIVRQPVEGRSRGGGLRLGGT